MQNNWFFKAYKDADAILENISVARAFTHEHQMEMLDQMAGLFYEQVLRVLRLKIKFYRKLILIKGWHLQIDDYRFHHRAIPR